MDGYSFYPEYTLLEEVYDGVSPHLETLWAVHKIEEEERMYGCTQYDGYLRQARKWEHSKLRSYEKERLTELINLIHDLLKPYLDEDIWDECLRNNAESKALRDVYSLELYLDSNYSHFEASLYLKLKNQGEFGPQNDGNKDYDTIGGELFHKLRERQEYDELALSLIQLLKTINKFLLTELPENLPQELLRDDIDWKEYYREVFDWRQLYERSIRRREKTKINIVNDLQSHAVIETCSHTLVTGNKDTVIPDSVMRIGSCAFKNCGDLQSIVIPDSVTSINKFAFANCTGLRSITIPNSVTWIGNYAFKGCANLQSITIPASVTNIGKFAFSDCLNLQSVTFLISVNKIGKCLFVNCPNLQSVAIDQSIEPAEKVRYGIRIFTDEMLRLGIMEEINDCPQKEAHAGLTYFRFHPDRYKEIWNLGYKYG